MIEKNDSFPKNIKFLKMFLWTRRMKFDNPAGKSLTKVQNFFCSMTKSDKKLSSKKISTQCISTLGMQFWRFRQKVGIRVENWPEVRKWKRKHSFSQKKVFFRLIFLWTRRLHFWQHCQNSFAWSRKKKSRCTEAKREIRFLSKQQIHSSPICASGHKECRFSDHAKKLCDEVPKAFAHCN